MACWRSAVARTCLAAAVALAATDAGARSEDDRRQQLEALARQQPMTATTVATFRAANQEGWFGVDAVLLARNRSPLAMALFASMMLDPSVDIEERIGCLHRAIVPLRSDPAILDAASAILFRTRDRALANAVVESVVDYRQRWFGLESRGGLPPAWHAAPTDSIAPALRFLDQALARDDVDPTLRRTVEEVRHDLAANPH